VKNRIKVGWLVVVAATAGAWLLFFATRSNEPTRDGRPLSYWLERLWHSDERVQLEAEGAIRSMGTNAVPHLIRMLPEREASWKQKYNYRIQGLFGNDWYRARRFFLGGRSHLAARGLRAIGPAAKQAVPFLIQNMTNYPLSASAASEYQYALVFIGADSVFPLTQALSHPDEALRTFAWGALSLCDNTNLMLAVPELTELAKSKDEETRAESIRVLGLISDDVRATSALVEFLKDSSDAVRHWAAQGLAYHGANAKSALPALLELLKDKSTNVQAAVRYAITAIDTNLVVEGTQVRRKAEPKERE
jgi:hypothetical protein